jgi:hypothetical protein
MFLTTKIKLLSYIIILLLKFIQKKNLNVFNIYNKSRQNKTYQEKNYFIIYNNQEESFIFLFYLCKIIFSP